MGRFLLSLFLLAASGWSQTITVIQPSAGAVWKKGETRTIQWTNQGTPVRTSESRSESPISQNDPVLVGEDFR